MRQSKNVTKLKLEQRSPKKGREKKLRRRGTRKR